MVKKDEAVVVDLNYFSYLDLNKEEDNSKDLRTIIKEYDEMASLIDSYPDPLTVIKSSKVKFLKDMSPDERLEIERTYGVKIKERG